MSFSEIPNATAQLIFLDQLQRVFDEGQFVGTYKFALLMAIAELSVELGEDSGAELRLTHRQLAEKVIELYWPHAISLSGKPMPDRSDVLAGGQVAIINLLLPYRHQYQTLARAKASPSWKKVVTKTIVHLKEMPLWRLQTLQREQLIFLYEADGTTGIKLLPGVQFNLRRFQVLVAQLARTAWISHLRGFTENASILGHVPDLEQLLFGSNRNSLDAARPFLREFQDNRCFYCQANIADAGEVDHFIPWSRYPRDMLHNFVLADRKCNQNKRDRLASLEHLLAWKTRNDQHGDQLAADLSGQFANDIGITVRVAKWSYQRVLAAGGQVWSGQDRLVAVDARCVSVL